MYGLYHCMKKSKYLTQWWGKQYDPSKQCKQQYSKVKGFISTSYIQNCIYNKIKNNMKNKKYSTHPYTNSLHLASQI